MLSRALGALARGIRQEKEVRVIQAGKEEAKVELCHSPAERPDNRQIQRPTEKPQRLGNELSKGFKVNTQEIN